MEGAKVPHKNKLKDLIIMKTNRVNNRILLFTAAILFSLGIMAQQGKGPRATGEGKLANFIPDLTEEQTAQIKDLRIQHLASMQENRAKAQVLQAELRQLEIADKADMNKINSKIDEISAVRNIMAKDRSKHKQEVRKLLTPEQRVIYDSHRKRGRGNGFGPAHASKKGRGQGQGYGQGQGKRGPCHN